MFQMNESTNNNMGYQMTVNGSNELMVEIEYPGKHLVATQS